MRHITLVAILLALTITCSAQFKHNSIGVAYIIGETTSVYELKIVFPYQTLENTNATSQGFDHKNDTIAYDGLLTFFDAKGKIGSFKPHKDTKEEITVERWCDHQGMIQYRPTVRMTLAKMWLPRILKSSEELQGVACFVIINQKNLKIPPPAHPIAGGIRLRGDFNDDGKADCHVWICYDQNNCSSKAKYLDINLQVGTTYFPLHCCE